MINGIINVYKETGYTSHDVVARLRGIVRQKKIGHTGTLDPDATGVLPVCLGKATKICSLLEDWKKTYRAVLLLGVSTDTEDTSGTVLSQKEVSVDEERIREIINGFLGDYSQIPPMYSAKKVGGKKLYELARQGIVVERKPSLVHIDEIRIEEVCLPRVTFTVTCSKGTYIRSLCRDIGDQAGCGGCMESLIRTKVGDFCLEQATRLDHIEQYQKDKRIEEILLPVDQVFAGCPIVNIPEEGNRLLYNGNPLPLSLCEDCSLAVSNQKEEAGKRASLMKFPENQNIRVYDKQGLFIGIYRRSADSLKPFKLFL